MIDRMFDGSVPLLFASLLHHKRLSKDEIEKLKQIVEELG